MQKAYVTITREQYDKLSQTEQGRRYGVMNDFVPDWARHGYGYYGFKGLGEKDGKYYAEILIGDSCD